MCDPRLHPVGPQEGEEYCPQVGSGSSNILRRRDGIILRRHTSRGESQPNRGGAAFELAGQLDNCLLHRKIATRNAPSKLELNILAYSENYVG